MKHTSIILLSLLAFRTNALQAKQITVEVLPEDEIKGLLVDANKYERNKWRSAGIAGASLAAGITTAFLTKRTDIAAIPVLGAVLTGGYSCWMWWSQKRSFRQAHELAKEHGVQIIQHTSVRTPDEPKTPEHDDSEKLEQRKDKATQTGN